MHRALNRRKKETGAMPILIREASYVLCVKTRFSMASRILRDRLGTPMSSVSVTQQIVIGVKLGHISSTLRCLSIVPDSFGSILTPILLIRTVPIMKFTIDTCMISHQDASTHAPMMATDTNPGTAGAERRICSNRFQCLTNHYCCSRCPMIRLQSQCWMIVIQGPHESLPEPAAQ